MPVRKKKIVDFKNDVLFKFTLNDDQDPDCLYLLRLIIESITDLKCCSLTVVNPELNPRMVEDKDMFLDIRVVNEDDEIINVEMQNSSLTRQQYQRFQIYGANMLAVQEKVGGDYQHDIHPVFQIIFIDDIDKDNLVLMDYYISRNDQEQSEKYYLLTRVYVYLPYINILKKEKLLEEFKDLEVAIYILENGIDDDIMKVGNEVVDIMKRKVEKFNQDEQLQDMAYKRDLSRWARKGEEKDIYESGLKEGQSAGKGEYVKKLFQSMYPQENGDFLNHLSVEQYDEIFEVLLSQGDLDRIYNIVG